MKLFFDVGANRGEATWIALNTYGFDKVIAFEPAPRMYKLLAENYFYDQRVVPLKVAVSDVGNETIEFYECGNGELNQGDGSSTMELSWIKGEDSRIKDIEYRTVRANTCTIDWAIEQYGIPHLVKIDVEGGESKVIAGMSYKPERLCFEWHIEHMDRHVEDLKRLAKINGYTEYALQYITHHLLEPTEYRPISEADSIYNWLDETRDAWQSSGWIEGGHLRQQADVGMIWVR